jgi:hypothetical protein
MGLRSEGSGAGPGGRRDSLPGLADEDPLSMVRRRGLDLFRTVDDLADCHA